MSLNTTTLANTRTKVAERADIEIAATTGRHTESQVNDLINESVRKYWLELVADGGWGLKLATVTTTTGTATTNGWEDNQHVALATDVLQVRAASINDGTQWIPMMPFDLPERDDYDGDYFSTTTGLPLFFRIALNDNLADIMWLSPRADAAYTIRYWYHKAPTALSADGDTWHHFPGTEDFVICDVAQKILARDGNPESEQLQLIRAQRAEALDIARKHARRRNKTGPGRRQNTRDMRKRHQWYAAGPWRRL